VVVGIGVNAAHAPDDFAAPLRAHATSLRIVSGWSPPRVEVAGALVRALAALPARFAATLSEVEMAELESRDALRGVAVRVVADGAASLEGTAMRRGAGRHPARPHRGRPDRSGALGTVRPLATPRPSSRWTDGRPSVPPRRRDSRLYGGSAGEAGGHKLRLWNQCKLSAPRDFGFAGRS
jgi:BirA family biotin operon repressor/biotin-[acetyl-CoA-carboxylase] ligase